MVITSLSLIFGCGPDCRHFLPSITVGNVSSIQHKQVRMNSSRLIVSLLSRIYLCTEESKSHEPFFVQGELAHRVNYTYPSETGSFLIRAACLMRYLVNRHRSRAV